MKYVPAYSGTLRSHLLDVPTASTSQRHPRLWPPHQVFGFFHGCSDYQKHQRGCYYRGLPLYAPALISQAIISVADVPVFVGVGGGVTNGPRSVRLAEYAEHQGAFGVVVNAPLSNETITQIKDVVDTRLSPPSSPRTWTSLARLAAGADILNVSGAGRTPEIISSIRSRFPDVPIIATGGPTDGDILRTIEAGANAITYTPPSTGALFAEMMRQYRVSYQP